MLRRSKSILRVIREIYVRSHTDFVHAQIPSGPRKMSRETPMMLPSARR